MSHGRKPTRDLDALSITYTAPGALKEKIKERATAVPLSCEYDHTGNVHEQFGGTYREKPEPETPKRRPSAKKAARPYAELRAASAFSFLDSSSLPEDLIHTAAEKDLPAMALVDTNGVYGAPRFYGAAKKVGVRALVGAELVMDAGSRTTVLVENRTGYRNLCKLITAGAAGREKGKARFSWELIEQYAEGLHCLTRGDAETVHRIVGIFRGRTHVELQRHRRRDEEHHNVRLIDLARRMQLPLVATNGVRYARKEDKDLHDIVTCIREGTHVDKAGRLLGINRERHIKSADEMCALFRDLPEAIDGAWSLANTLDFTLADLGYQFPDYPLPPGETSNSFLRKIAWNAARARFRPLTARAQAQIEKELNMIEKLDLAGYFLIVWDIVQFCNREKILVQGRGSAANSAVCYALGITAVDPVKMELLFERFLSEERGEWPDIDIDLFTRGVTPDGHLRPTREQAPDLYKPSPLGWIPREWEVVRIADAFDIQLGKMLNKLAKTGKLSAPYVGNRAVQWDYVDCSAVEEMDFTSAERQKFILLPNDLLVCEGGDVGRTAMWRGEIENCYYQKAIHRLRPKSFRALPSYMLRFMKFARDAGYFREFTSQSSIAHLTQEKLGSIDMQLPPSDEQYRIADRLDAHDDVLQTEQSKLAKLHQQKHGLMHDLLTGRVRVPVAAATEGASDV